MVVDVAWIPWITRLRMFLIDFTRTNELLNDQESTEEEIQYALEDSLEYINFAYQPRTVYSYGDVASTIPWYLVRDGAVINVLKSNMLNSARNQHTYSDSGGVQGQDQDVYGRYINLINIMETQFKRDVKEFKSAVNLNSGFGGVSSEYSLRYENDTNIQ